MFMYWCVYNRPDTKGWCASNEFLSGQWERLDENTHTDGNDFWTSGRPYPFVQPLLTTSKAVVESAARRE